MTAEQVRVRPCEARDLEHFGLFGAEAHVQYCRDEFARRSVAILVAVSEDDVPVGKIHVHFEHKEGAVWLEAAAVARPRQGQGIGTNLVHAAEALAAERGYDTAELGVEDSNPRARRLYERVGYRSVARTDFQYLGAPVPNPGVTMRKALARESISAEQVWAALEEVEDPEIPVVSLVDLGVVRDVQVEGDRAHVEFTPTFLGCPALEVMRDQMAAKIVELGLEPHVEVIIDDSWSTDRITPAGREKLRAAGFAPPAPREATAPTLIQLGKGFRCPYCGSTDTRLDNLFGPTPCRSIRYCESCRQPFEQFKTI